MGFFNDPVSHLCLAGGVVESWSLTQEVIGSSPFTVMANCFVSLNSLNSAKHLLKTPMSLALFCVFLQFCHLRSQCTHLGQDINDNGLANTKIE